MADKIKIHGKIVQFPRNTATDQALNILETIKVNPKKVWYVMVETQDNCLKMVKYKHYNGVNLYKYTNGLKEYYINKFTDKQILEKISNIEVVGEDAFSIIKNIPLDVIVEDNMSLLTKITKDLMILLND